MSNENQPQDFPDTPLGWGHRWRLELEHAKKDVAKWHDQGVKILDRFRDERDTKVQFDTRWNVFTSNIQTQRAILYGNTPKCSVERRFQDANDDTARVAAEMLERLLNTDIERDSDSYALAIQYALDDRLLVGLGFARLRYVSEFETVETPAITEVDPVTGQTVEVAPAVIEEKKTREDVEVDYGHWKDQLWGPSRVFHEIPWWATKSDMSRSELVKRFTRKNEVSGLTVGEEVPLAGQRERDDSAEPKPPDPWARAVVWEIWHKESKKVFWVADGYPEALDIQDDPLGLEGFWPFPRPMVANPTTSKFLPRPDFVLAQDLYDEIDNISTRITELEQAVKVVGIYDKEDEEVGRMLNGKRNTMIPSSNFAKLSEKGGVRGSVDWFPLDQVVNALAILRDYRRELLDTLYQITGLSDIMRGQATDPNETATAQGIKAKFGSVRMQSMQDEFARFASDIQKLRAEIIAKLFDAQTILQRCNCENTPDQPKAMAAVELIKSQLAQYRVQVKPEAVSLTDFASLKSERIDQLGAIGTFLQVAMPLAQMMPGIGPFLWQILQTQVAGLRGASQLEAILDQAILAAQQQAAQPQQQQMDPKEMMKLQGIQMKGQVETQKEQLKFQNSMALLHAETQAKAEQEQNQMVSNVREAAAKQQVANALKPPESVKPGGFKR